MWVKSFSLVQFSCSVVSDSATAWTAAHQAPLSWDFPGKNAAVGCHALLQGMYQLLGSLFFPTKDLTMPQGTCLGFEFFVLGYAPLGACRVGT